MRGGIFVRALIVATLLFSTAPALAHERLTERYQIVFDGSWSPPVELASLSGERK